jgi:hypothetical protein
MGSFSRFFRASPWQCEARDAALGDRQWVLDVRSFRSGDERADRDLQEMNMVMVAAQSGPNSKRRELDYSSQSRVNEKWATAQRRNRQCRLEARRPQPSSAPSAIYYYAPPPRLRQMRRSIFADFL